VAHDNLVQAALKSPLIPPIQRRLDAGEFLRLNSVADAGKPFLAHLLSQISNRPVLIVTDGLKSQEAFFNDLQTFSPDALFYPAWETLPHEDQLPHADTIADRLKVLGNIVIPSLRGISEVRPGEVRDSSQARNDRNIVIIASVQALMQRTFAPSALANFRFPVSLGQTLELQDLTDRLQSFGYHPEFQVNERGDMAFRGGIVDFFPLDRDCPVRIEFAGDEIESIRTFDPVTQQSREKLDTVTLTPAGELGLLKKNPSATATLIELLPPNTLLILDEPDNLLLAAADYARQIPDADPFFEPWDKTLQSPLQRVELTEAPDFTATGALNLRLTSLDAFRPLDTRTPEPEIADRMRRSFFDQIQQWLAEDYTLHILCSTDGEQQRFEELWREHTGKPPSSFVLRPSSFLSHGFLWPDAKLAVVTDSEIFGRYKPVRPRRKFHAATSPISDWSELQPGDYVVHLQHGIAKYLGLKTIVVSGAQQEVLALEYANEARLYVPVDQAHLVTKYIGAGKRVPKLHELGGSLWQRQKFTAERAIMDLAAELLEIQAARATLTGHAFQPDTPWQREFEAAFIYDETPDQLSAIEDVKLDMESTKPMDRLICGDVGYGKTEVAIRAAFKAVMDGFQVAVLCPTTILAEQHWNTFRERMAGYPITVEMLSRFRTPAEQKKIVSRTGEGGVDILIGTHRLLSADVQFKNLGLVVIDEEQRFGVLHKERFKQLRKLIDVITLSATPIPRTLYLSLTGARDMSTIETPPQDRLPVETIITPYDERLIKQAIQRELNRGGQVYFLHNRVQTIDATADRLRKLFSDSPLRIDVGHGQMSDDELESVMHRFVAGHTDVLVCTTIIESGLDIPNANTIIIDRADRFGLSDLYQLRGRVGRYKHQAYAYILLPRHLSLVQSARKRISAIRQYSSLGSGFKIAMRDLEIRGAGNILGSEQSGHITAIGFDLYCQLLKESIGRLKGQKPKRLAPVTLKLDFLTGNLTAIPEMYIRDGRLRIQAYRKIAGITDLAEVKTLRAELRDRYGRLPRQLRLLLQTAEVKVLAAGNHIETIETRADKIILTQRGQLFQVGGRFPRLTESRPEGKLTEIRNLLESLLLPAGGQP
jgi:transcription-repair coupling factor (superfamily II helicase)